MVPRKPFKNVGWLNELGAGVAVLVSLISLWIGVRTEQANSKMVDANYRMVAASSWPFLQLDSGNGDDQGHAVISLQLQNAGVGPAKIESFELFWHDHAYPNAKALLMACCAGEEPSNWAISTNPSSNFVLRAGESRSFIRFALTEQNAKMWAAFDRVRFSELSYRVCYCSVFDECWITRLTALRVEPVTRCPRPAVPFGELKALGAANRNAVIERARELH